VPRLSPRQIRDLADCILGDGDAGEHGFQYRTHAQLDAFFDFTGSESQPADDSGSRATRAAGWLSAANRGDEGASGLPVDVERILRALLDRREFDSADDQGRGVARVATVLEGVNVRIAVDGNGGLELRSARRGARQAVLETQIHTVFETSIRDADLDAARIHYAKARRHLDAAEPDFENSAKEAVSSVEALAVVMTGERDLPAAIRKATQAGLIPRPLDDLIVKLYAYRGNEPGVGHGQAAAPEVTREDAEFVLNLAGSIGKYLREKLARPDE
jgi:hypothetical protein